MKKEPLYSKRIKLINQSIQELYDDVSDLSECLIDGDFEFSMKKSEDLRIKVKLVQDMIKEGHILRIKQ